MWPDSVEDAISGTVVATAWMMVFVPSVEVVFGRSSGAREGMTSDVAWVVGVWGWRRGVDDGIVSWLGPSGFLLE